MRLLVTGGCGFIFSHFIRHILQKYPDYKIINLDKLTYCGNIESTKDFRNNRNYKFIKGDICDKKLVERTVKEVDVIINGAAETHVDRSIIDAGTFVRTDVFGTYVLLEAARKNDVEKYIQISCYDEQTRAVTRDGFKYYWELRDGDKVFSINPQTGFIEEKEIEKVIVQNYEGDMIHFKSSTVDLKVTPNHRVLYRRRLGDTSKIRIAEAKDIATRCPVLLPKGQWGGIKCNGSIFVDNVGEVSSEDLFYLAGIFIGDGFVAPQVKQQESKTGLSHEEFVRTARDENGRFISVGKIGDRDSIKIHSWRIFFDIPENDKARDRVESVLTNLNIKYSMHKGKAGEHIYFSSREWTDFFVQFGRGAKNKNIPEWMLQYDKKYLRALFDGLIDSDGYCKKHSDKHTCIQYTTVSQKLTKDLCELGFKLGYYPTFRQNYRTSVLEGRTISGKASYIYFPHEGRDVGKSNAKSEFYRGRIWCVKVRDNKNLLVERNGKLAFCGNTDEVYGSIEKESFRESSPLNPNSPYSASKAGADLLVGAYRRTYGIPTIITRSSNNYGPYQFPEKLIPLFITNLLRGKKVPLYGDGSNVRDWLFVTDNCAAVDTVLHKGKIGETYNIASSDERTNLEMTKMLLKLLGKPESMIQHVQDRKGHDFRYSMDCSKMRAIGWKPRLKLEDGLEMTIEWYENNEWWWRPLVKKLGN